MQKLNKMRLVAFPAGLFLAFLMLICSEIFALPILVPLALLPIIIGLVYLAPFLSVWTGWFYEKAFGQGIQGTLIASSLRYRSTSIGLSVVLLFCICTVSTVTVGLANAGLGQVSTGVSFWKPGLYWGSLKDNADTTEIDINGNPGVLGTFGQGRIERADHRSTTVFVMHCADYATISADNPDCPIDDAESLLVPVDTNIDTLTPDFTVGTLESTRHLELPPLEIKEVPGLTEILISTTNQEINSVDRYVYADLDKLPPSVVLSILTQTDRGLGSQEYTDRLISVTASGYREAAVVLELIILLFGLSAVTGIAVAAVKDRRKLFDALTLRGVQESVVKRLIRIETISITLPFALFGCITGALSAAAIAAVSSLNPRDTLTPYTFAIMLIYIVAVPLITEIQLHNNSKNSVD